MLTVLMATHNGAGTLPRVLAAYGQLRPPAGGWRLVVADNASSDATPDILNRYSKQLPLDVVRTERRGKNIALNLALNALQGDLVVFTDDDAVPEADWLETLTAAAAAQPEYDMFGGRIVPVWPEATPEWIGRLVNLGATYAVTPTGLEEGPVPAGQLWGPNMAIRRTLFDAGHRFNEAVGPAAGDYVMGSEVDFTCRMEALGHRSWFVSQAVVGHIIRPHQLERDWIVRRSYRLGRHMFHMEQPELPQETPRWRGAPRWKYRQWLTMLVQEGWGWTRRDSDTQLTAAMERSFLSGYIAEAARCNRAPQGAGRAH